MIQFGKLKEQWNKKKPEGSHKHKIKRFKGSENVNKDPGFSQTISLMQGSTKCQLRSPYHFQSIV